MREATFILGGTREFLLKGYSGVSTKTKLWLLVKQLTYCELNFTYSYFFLKQNKLGGVINSYVILFFKQEKFGCYFL